MNLFEIAALILLICLVIGVVLAIVRARRLDALHKNVVRSRKTLENALLARSAAAVELANSGSLDVASAVLLAGIAKEAQEAAAFPIIDDGLGALADHPEQVTASSSRPDRLLIESELSRVLRIALEGAEADDIEELDMSRQAVRMTRRFHNIHVSRTLAVRRTFLARVFHLYGSAPCPRTVDLDDE